jgi:ATP/maltotriose-dependent transcriptional regulator MalT
VTVGFYGGVIAVALALVELARLAGWRFPLAGRPADWATAAAALVFLLLGLAVSSRARRRGLDPEAPRSHDGGTMLPDRAAVPTAAPPTGVGAALIEPLTPREVEILASLAAGLSNAEIAARHFVTANTVKTHLRQIYGKLEVARRVQAVQRARQLGLIS